MNRLSPKGRRKIPDVLMNFGRHLVYSEGTKSEPNYIESIKKAISKKYDCEPNDINIVCANGEKSYNTTGLIKFVESDVKNDLKTMKESIMYGFFLTKMISLMIILRLLAIMKIKRIIQVM